MDEPIAIVGGTTHPDQARAFRLDPVHQFAGLGANRAAVEELLFVVGCPTMSSRIQADVDQKAEEVPERLRRRLDRRDPLPLNPAC